MSFFRELVAQRKTFLQNFCLILFCCCCLLDWLLWVWIFAFIWVEGFFEGVYLSNRKVTNTEDKSRGSKSRREAERASQGGNHHWQSSGKLPSVSHTSERGDSRMPGTWTPGTSTGKPWAILKQDPESSQLPKSNSRTSGFPNTAGWMEAFKLGCRGPSFVRQVARCLIKFG